MPNDVLIQPALLANYQHKIRRGRRHPFGTMDGYLRAALEHDQHGKVRFNDKGEPILRPIENVYFYLGMPLPSAEITARIARFQERLRRTVPSKRVFHPNPPEELHVTLFDYRWNGDSVAPSPHPLPNDPRRLQAFLKDVMRILRSHGPIAVYFKELALFENGVIVACGYPQDFPQGFPGPSSIDLAREKYLRTHPEAERYPDITHITVGRFLKQITERGHRIALDEIARFNRTPLGTITFREVEVLHETRYWLSKVRSLATLDLVSGTVKRQHSSLT